MYVIITWILFQSMMSSLGSYYSVCYYHLDLHAVLKFWGGGGMLNGRKEGAFSGLFFFTKKQGRFFFFSFSPFSSPFFRFFVMLLSI